MDKLQHGSITRAAAALATARAPAVAIVGADVAATRAALRLAARLGAVFDIVDGGVEAEVAAFESFGAMTTTPGQAVNRADLIVLIGPTARAEWDRRFDARVRIKRQYAPPLAPTARVEIGATAARIPVDLRRIGAALAGRDGGDEHLRAQAEKLRSASFGVMLWDARDFPADVAPHVIAAIQTLLRELNRKNRFSGLPLSTPPSAATAMLTAVWTTGFANRLSFAARRPLRDAFAFDAVRASGVGEIDALVWIDADGAGDEGAPPGPAARIVIAPESALGDSALARSAAPAGTAGAAAAAGTAGAATAGGNAGAWRFACGRPGVDHDALLVEPRLGQIVRAPASAPSGAPAAAAVIDALAAALGPAAEAAA